MSPDDFTSDSPGRLVKTSFDDRVMEGGKPATRRVQGWAFVPNDLPPMLDTPRLLEIVFDDLVVAERSLARLDGIGEDFPNARLLWAPLANREAILSSAIEDTIATALELATLQAGERSERQEPTEVLNYVSALEYGLNSELPICTRLIRGMHEHLMAHGVRGSELTPGEIRTTQNFIGKRGEFAMARFVPPPPGEPLTRGLDALEAYANRRSLGVPKLIAIAMMHYQFEALHPFPDGNGRIGRLLSALSLCRLNLLKQPFVYLSGFFEPNQRQYNDLLLRVSTEGAWLPWIQFFTKGLAHQAKDAEERVRRLRELRATYREKASTSNLPGRSFRVIDDLFSHPAITVEGVATRLEVTKPTARSYIRKLEALGVVTPLSLRYRSLWIAHEIIDFIDARPA